MAISESRNPGEIFGIEEAIVSESCSLSMKLSQTFFPPPFLQSSGLYQRSSSHAIFAFSPAFSLDDWDHRIHHGDDLSLFPSLRLISGYDTALIHPPFLRRFHQILATSLLDHEVRRAVTERKRIIFTGHSSGGPIAVLATIWLLEQSLNLKNPTNQSLPICITFGSPLVGDIVFGHALRREDWAQRFLHFVSRYDLVPRLLLSPVDPQLHHILQFFHPNSPSFNQEDISSSQQTLHMYTTVMRNASYVATHRACEAMGSTNLLLDALLGLVKMSPYRPVGTYVFCVGNEKLVIVKNSDAVLQLLFYCLQVSPEESVAEIASKSLKKHLMYESEVRHCLEKMDVVCLEHLEKVPLSSEDGGEDDQMALIQSVLNELGMSTEARLSLRATGEIEKQKMRNQGKIDSNYSKIEKALKSLESYKSSCALRGVGYYDSFKLQRDIEDFNANLKRLELAGLFDEILEMMKRYELPDAFVTRVEWVEMGTNYRRLVEPLDIANYYRHSLNEETGPYLNKGRPKRYKLPQQLLERIRRLPAGSCSESCFWATVEELRIEKRSFAETKERVLELEKQLLGWLTSGEMTKDVLVEGSTFVQWWKTLPDEHRMTSCIGKVLIDGVGRNAPIV
ncbi:protein EDS1-like [Aristolochia californica]|uniref:protein EDS1-like n=1 Tax=Aristolochia californica TaxID=171875 RepID=UPI0035D945D2